MEAFPRRGHGNGYAINCLDPCWPDGSAPRHEQTSELWPTTSPIGSPNNSLQGHPGPPNAEYEFTTNRRPPFVAFPNLAFPPLRHALAPRAVRTHPAILANLPQPTPHTRTDNNSIKMNNSSDNNKGEPHFYPESRSQSQWEIMQNCHPQAANLNLNPNPNPSPNSNPNPKANFNSLDRWANFEASYYYDSLNNKQQQIQAELGQEYPASHLDLDLDLAIHRNPIYEYSRQLHSQQSTSNNNNQLASQSSLQMNNAVSSRPGSSIKLQILAICSTVFI